MRETKDQTITRLKRVNSELTEKLRAISRQNRSARREERDSIIEVNHSNFILWNNKTKTTKITKVGSQIDVLPTLLNLFGIEYDSRLLVGKDILSNSEGLAIFSNRSWVTDKGTYFANGKTFIPKEGAEIPENYVDYMNNEIANKYVISKLIVEHNYYKYVLGNGI